MFDHPNILLIHSDQHRFDCLGINGHPLLQTPHLDALAAQGVNFTHAFTPNPVCSPARACLQTGAWATTHKCVTIPNTEAFQPADTSLPVLTQLLADNGYRVDHVGKFHREVVGEPTDHGATTYVHGEAYDRWREQQSLPPRPHTQGYYGEVDSQITPQQSPLAWQADRVLELLDEHSKREQPFFLRWDPPEPHLPNIVPEPFASMYPIEEIEPWPSFSDPLVNKSPAQRRTRLRWGTDDWSWEMWAPIVQRYLGEVSLLDQQVGRLMRRLDELGLADNTLVIYTTDHGDMCGGHSMMDKHYVMYDDILRVPMIVRWPGVLPQGQVSNAMVIHELDIARTILSAAEVMVPASFVGYDLRDLVCGEVVRGDIFSQYQGTHQGLYSMRALRNRRFKYVYQPSGIDELYDLHEDPDEIYNLIGVPEMSERCRQMQQRMDVWMREIEDSLRSPLFDWGRSRLPSDHPAYCEDRPTVQV